VLAIFEGGQAGQETLPAIFLLLHSEEDMLSKVLGPFSSGVVTTPGRRTLRGTASWAARSRRSGVSPVGEKVSEIAGQFAITAPAAGDAPPSR
jgi:hypothetical protein